MQKKFVNIYVAVILMLVLFISCEKDITVDIPNPENQIVVEGFIENGEFPYVILTRNSAYFEPVDTATLQNLLVINAKVFIDNGDKQVQLYLSGNSNRFPYIYYQTNEMIGETGKTYHLRVEADNKVLTASTTIPEAVHIDSLRFKPQAPFDSLGYLWFYFVDPDTLGNYYRIFTKVVGKDSIFHHPFASVADDQFINGQEVEYSTYYNPDTNMEENDADQDDEPDFYFKVGEKVVLKLCSITADHYFFWSTIEQQMMSGGNPFASPATVKTNINGGLGIWGSYGANTDTLIIKLN